MSVVPVPVLVPNCLAPANLEGAAVVSEVQEEEEVAMECLGLMQSLDQGRVGGAEKGADPVPFLPHWQCQASLLHHCSLYSVEWGAQLKRLEDGHPIPAIRVVISSMSGVSAWGENMAGTRPGDSAASRQEARSANLMARSSPGAIPRAEEILWLISWDADIAHLYVPLRRLQGVLQALDEADDRTYSGAHEFEIYRHRPT